MAKKSELCQYPLEMVSIRLVKDAPLLSERTIRSPDDAVRILGEYVCQMDREVVCVINLRTDGCPINCSICSIGAVSQVIAHPRDILKTAILSNADKILLIHNHPSGNLEPSAQDTKLTDQLSRVCWLLGVPLVDHIIVGGDNTEYFSFKEKDIIPSGRELLETGYEYLDLDKPVAAEEGGAKRRGRYHR